MSSGAFWPHVFLVLGADCIHCADEDGVRPSPCQALHVKQILPVLAVCGSSRTHDLEMLQAMPLALLWPLMGSQAVCSVALSLGCFCSSTAAP